MMSFPESGNKPEYLVQGHFSTSDRPGDIGCPHELCTLLKLMSARKGFTDACLRSKALFGVTLRKLPRFYGCSFQHAIPKTVRHLGESTDLRGKFR